MLLLLVFIVKILACCLATYCPDGWLAFEGSCYWFGADNIHFTEAKQYCRQHNAHLLHIESSVENSFLKGFLNDIIEGSHKYWLGMTDELIEGVWIWNDNNGTLEYSDWGPHEPNNHDGNQDCAVLYPDLQYKWNDHSCTNTYRALCEKSGEANPCVVG